MFIETEDSFHVRGFCGFERKRGNKNTSLYLRFPHPLLQTANWRAFADIFGPGGAPVLVQARDARRFVRHGDCHCALSRSFVVSQLHRLVVPKSMHRAIASKSVNHCAQRSVQSSPQVRLTPRGCSRRHHCIVAASLSCQSEVLESMNVSHKCKYDQRSGRHPPHRGQRNRGCGTGR